MDICAIKTGWKISFIAIIFIYYKYGGMKYDIILGSMEK